MDFDTEEEKDLAGGKTFTSDSYAQKPHLSGLLWEAVIRSAIESVEAPGGMGS